MTHTTKHTPLDKATRAIPMLYAEAFAGSNNKEFVVELYSDARLLETAAPAMYHELDTAPLPKHNESASDFYARFYTWYEGSRKTALAQAEGRDR